MGWDAVVRQVGPGCTTLWRHWVCMRASNANKHTMRAAAACWMIYRLRKVLPPLVQAIIMKKKKKKKKKKENRKPPHTGGTRAWLYAQVILCQSQMVPYFCPSSTESHCDSQSYIRPLPLPQRPWPTLALSVAVSVIKIGLPGCLKRKSKHLLWPRLKPVSENVIIHVLETYNIYIYIYTRC